MHKARGQNNPALCGTEEEEPQLAAFRQAPRLYDLPVRLCDWHTAKTYLLLPVQLLLFTFSPVLSPPTAEEGFNHPGPADRGPAGGGERLGTATRRAPEALGRAPGPFPPGPRQHRHLPFGVTPASSHACFTKFLSYSYMSALGCHLPFLISSSQVGKGPPEINWPSSVLPGRAVLLPACLPCHI